MVKFAADLCAEPADLGKSFSDASDSVREMFRAKHNESDEGDNEHLVWCEIHASDAICSLR